MNQFRDSKLKIQLLQVFENCFEDLIRLGALEYDFAALSLKDLPAALYLPVPSKQNPARS